LWKQDEEEFNDLIDWQRMAKEDIKTRRFCPQCMQLVKLKLREHKYFQNFYSCPNCGEIVYSRVTVPQLSSRGYKRR
jgi:predicted RNA-binding Zn-ribbon protein involved in translation (DUF1610 family)